EAASEMNLDASRVRTLGIPDHWIYQDSRATQLAEAGIDANGIARAVRTLVHHTGSSQGAEAPTRQPAAG
ncbi:MAG: hypothetical protein ACTS27_02915, partial [Phycisphaerales bacterium]